MKLSIACKLKGNRGLSKFASLLIKRLSSEYGVKLVQKNEKSDIHLIVIHGRCKPGAKNILRLDGVYYDVDRVQRLGLNHPIRSSVREVDGVVYQSQWCKVFVEGMLKVKPRQSAVIHNGSDRSKFDGAVIDKMGFDKILLACAHWRINKRLESIVKSFIEAQRIIKKNIGLVVLGKPDYSCKHPKVKFLNDVEGSRLYSIYKSSDYMCHICHLDACPNSVIDGLLVGLPVLCNNIGGTPELVQNDGVIVNIDKPFDFRTIKSMKKVGPKSVDLNLMTEGMLSMFQQEWTINRPDLDIAVSARKYYEFFKKVLG